MLRQRHRIWPQRIDLAIGFGSWLPSTIGAAVILSLAYGALIR